MRFICNWSSLIERPNCILNSSCRYQFLATLTVVILTFSHGIALGWAAPTLAKLRSPNTPLNFPVSIQQISWIGSLVGVGSLCGNLIFGFLLDRIGRKICIYLLAVPHICLWVLIYFAQNVQFLYVARFFCGITGGGCFLVLSIYISEISNTGVRGTLSSMIILSLNFGILTGFILSTYLSYYAIPFVVIVLPLVYVLASVFFPETPHHLLRKNKLLAAEKSFKFYNNCDSSNGANQQFMELQSSIASRKEQSNLNYKDFVSKKALKAMCTAAVILFVNQYCGIYAFMTYMTQVFAVSGSPLEPTTGTIIMGAVQIIGAYVATILTDRCGRKLLMLLSTGGMALSLTMFGLLTHFESEINLECFKWISLVLMATYVFLANVGVNTLTFVLLVETFPAKIRSICVSVAMALLSILVFSILKIFPGYLHAFGISITMWSCAAICVFSFLYLSIFQRETKGSSMNG